MTVLHYPQTHGCDAHRRHSDGGTNTRRPLERPGEEAEPGSCVVLTPNPRHHCNCGKMLDNTS